VKEQSHKDEMSKALKGDFERLRDRGVATTLAPRDEPQAGPVTEPSTAPREPEPEPDEPRTSWLDRILGR
jgi:hypothetical protein